MPPSHEPKIVKKVLDLYWVYFVNYGLSLKRNGYSAWYTSWNIIHITYTSQVFFSGSNPAPYRLAALNYLARNTNPTHMSKCHIYLRASRIGIRYTCASV